MRDGSLQDVGIYCINACRYLFDAEPIDISEMHIGLDNDPPTYEIKMKFLVTHCALDGKSSLLQDDSPLK